MNDRDRVSLTDAQTTHYGTITNPPDQQGMCSVKWDSGSTERIHKDELETVVWEPAATGLLISDEDVPEFEKAIEDQLLTAQIGAPPDADAEAFEFYDDPANREPAPGAIPTVPHEHGWGLGEEYKKDDQKFSWWERIWHRFSQ